MVRLKAIFPACNFIHVLTFQFQYGAIKGIAVNGNLKNMCEFQFQYGAIKGWSAGIKDVHQIKISIPIWCD